jgi:hypothetical protein
MDKCIECGKLEVYIKKVQLCQKCYMRERKKKARDNGHAVFERTMWPAEIRFIKAFFSRTEQWIYHPVIFRTSLGNYEPDFYDVERKIFIEVVGTRQAYSSNLDKYHAMRKEFPDFKLEVREAGGSEIDIDKPFGKTQI